MGKEPFNTRKRIETMIKRAAQFFFFFFSISYIFIVLSRASNVAKVCNLEYIYIYDQKVR